MNWKLWNYWLVLLFDAFNCFLLQIPGFPTHYEKIVCKLIVTDQYTNINKSSWNGNNVRVMHCASQYTWQVCETLKTSLHLMLTSQVNNRLHYRKRFLYHHQKWSRSDFSRVYSSAVSASSTVLGAHCCGDDNNHHHPFTSDFLELPLQHCHSLKSSHDNFGPTVMGECTWKGMKWWHLCPFSIFLFEPSCTAIFEIISAGRLSHISEMFQPISLLLCIPPEAYSSVDWD